MRVGTRDSTQYLGNIMGVTICELDLTKLVLKKYKPDIITDIDPCKIKKTLESKDIIEVVDEDPLLQQEMVDAGQDVLEKASKAIATELKGFDDDASKVLEKTGLREGTLKFAQGFEKFYGDSAEEAGD